MWERIRRELLIEYYWWKRHSGKRKNPDSRRGLWGMLLITSGIIVMIIVGQAFATIFRSMIPLVGGNQVAGVYWSSVILALKFSTAFLLFLISLILFFFWKLSRWLK
ncbi:MAG: hypothetical protein ACOX7U_08640 [Desulfitobacteriia bacterium]|jgi:uncharacterized membrane protein YdbT with pleckstrin-like domain